MEKIDKSTRLISYLIDTFCILILWIFVSILFMGFYIEAYVIYFIFFIYYFIFESITGQTAGKLVTRTKVVHKDGTKANVFKIFLRSFLRLVPIDAFSYLFGTSHGFHDVLSGTKLKKISL